MPRQISNESDFRLGKELSNESDFRLGKDIESRDIFEYRLGQRKEGFKKDDSEFSTLSFGDLGESSYDENDPNIDDDNYDPLFLGGSSNLARNPWDIEGFEEDSREVYDSYDEYEEVV
jgi:hypothetical protein